MISEQKIKQQVNGIDVTNQSEIDSLKRIYPGQGVGPAVQEKLVQLLSSKDICAVDLPEEYSFLGHF